VRVCACLFLTLSCFGAQPNIGHIPLNLGFEKREGEFVSRGPGYRLFLRSDGAVLTAGGRMVRMSMVGASAGRSLQPLDRMPGRAHYFLGRDPEQSYELYAGARVHDAYRGIDAIFHANQQRLEYDFEVAPGSDPASILLRFEGADENRINAQGDLILRAGGIEIRQPRPVAFQQIAGRKTQVSVAYAVDADQRIRFRVGRYDRTRPLTIDPELVFSNLFGDISSSAADVALDGQGNIYVTGRTGNGGFPVKNAEQPNPGAAPLLVGSAGGNAWVTPALGTAGAVRSLAASPTAPSQIYAATSTGVIKSVDGGTSWTAPANQGLPSFIVSIAVDAGSPLTVYAGSYNQGVFTSTDGGATWTGSTNGLIAPGSTPPTPAELSVVVAHPSKPGTVFAIAQAPDFEYRSTDFGRTWTQLNVPLGGSPVALAFSPTDPNTIFLGQKTGPLFESLDGGDTWTSDTKETVQSPQGLAFLPSNPSILFAAAAAELDRSSDGGQTFTKVLALNNGSVAADPKTAAVVYALDQSGLYRSADAGLTWTKAALPYEAPPMTLFVSAADSRVFVGQSLQPDAFVTKWSPDGSQVLYSTYLGGSGYENATGIAVDTSGNAYVTGFTASADFPVTAHAFQKMLSPVAGGLTAQNAFIMKLSPDGSKLLYSTLLGGGTEGAGRIAVDAAGEAVVTGATSSSTFPVTANAFQSAPVTGCSPPVLSIGVETGGDAFVTKLAADGGSLVYSTLLGGSCGSSGVGIAVDAKGNTWVTGATDSPDFPVTPDALQRTPGGDVYDGFVARFDSGGVLQYATYLGGAGFDKVSAVTFDQAGNVFLTGTSAGLLQAPSAGAYQTQGNGTCFALGIGPPVYEAEGSAFVMKLDPAAHTVLGLTYLGYPWCLFPAAITVDDAGEPWIGGTVSPVGSAVPTVSPFAIGVGSGFVSKFSTDFTQLLFSTYFGSVSGLAVDPGGIAYVVGNAAPAGSSSGNQAYVAKVNPAPDPISLDAVVNPALASSRNPGVQGVAAGEVIHLVGRNMGPAQTAPGIITGGVLAAAVAGVQVLFDGVPAPLLSVSASEIDLVAPFELAGKSATTVQVQYNGAKSKAAQVAVLGAVLQVLGVYNSDFSVNSAANPATAGSIVTMYVSGAGQTVPPSQDGQVNQPPLLAPSAPVQLSGAEVTFAGAAPGLAAGILQVNFIAPQQTLTISPVIIGNASAQFNVYVR
jgi:uncharacterized protein (TIGR03437 family)